MEYLLGIGLAIVFCAAAAALGMDRERVFYPAVAMAVASYYLAFTVADGRSQVWLAELAIAAVFVAAAVLGFKRSPWIALLALGGHGVMDAFHHLLVHNQGVPGAWPGFCGSFDVTAAVVAAWLMQVRARRARTVYDSPALRAQPNARATGYLAALLASLLRTASSRSTPSRSARRTR